MKKQFVTYDIALKLKELGFNEECLACYAPHLGKGVFELIREGSSNESSKFNERFIKAGALNGCSAPLWQQAIDWLKINNVLVAERWDGWEFGAYEWDDFIYWHDKEEIFLKALELIKK